MTETRGAYLMNLGQAATSRPGSSSARSPQQSAQGAIPDTVLLLEHPPTITLGRRTDGGRGAHPVGCRGRASWRSDRGGKSTYHGPGQLVCYPILDLNRHGRDVKLYCRNLEEAIIRAAATFGLDATRIDGLTGVWLRSPPRKIASIGVHISRWVTTHGYALNVDLDPAPFTEVDHRLRARRCGVHDACARDRHAGHGRRRPRDRSRREEFATPAEVSA